METREQWYKPNLLYNIHWRPSKKPEPPKMVVETVRFNPSVCTCGDHDCEPRYRMERRVLWTSKEISGTKQNTGGSIGKTNRDGCIDKQDSKEKVAEMSHDSNEDSALDAIGESRLNMNGFSKEATIDDINGNSHLCGPGDNAHAYRKGCGDDEVKINENRKRDGIMNSRIHHGKDETNSVKVEGCSNNFQDSRDVGVDASDNGESTFDDLDGNGIGLKTDDKREDNGDKNSCSSGTGEDSVYGSVDSCYDGRFEVSKTDYKCGRGIGVDCHITGVGLGYRREFSDGSGVRKGIIGNGSKTDDNEGKRVKNCDCSISNSTGDIDGIEIRVGEYDARIDSGSDDCSIPNNNGKTGCNENKVGEYDAKNNIGSESTAEESSGYIVSVYEASGDDSYAEHENATVQDDQEYCNDTDDEISPAFGIFSIYCNSELHFVVQSPYSSGS